jgi:addiction module RelE/StbE family toxin
MRLRWTRRAAADLNRIAARVIADNPSAARDFAAALRARAERLRQLPFLGRPGALDDTRELIVHRNYILTYRVHGDEAQALQLWNVARNLPRTRRGRE